MTLPAEGGNSRWQTEVEVVRQLLPALADIDSELELQYYRYGAEAEPLASDQVESILAQPPTARRTDLAAALRASLAGAAGQPLAGVILLGDGTSTVNTSNPGAVARTLQSLDVPLWTVPIGPRVDSGQTRDLAVEQLAEEYRVFSKNLFRISAAVRARGMVGRDIPISVTLINDEGQREEVASRILLANSAEETLPIDLELTAPEPGSYRLELQAEPQPGETLTDNNLQIAFLDVRAGGGRIFYLEGQPRFEQKFLRRAINASPDLALQYRWIDSGSRRKWPVDLGDAVTPGRFDVFIIGDLDAAALGNENLRQIARAVEMGAGLLMLGGLHTFDVGGYASSPLSRVLPLQLDPTRRLAVGTDPPADVMLPGPVEVRVRRPHPITQLTNSGNNLELWQQLKPLLGANRFVGAKVSPTVEVLLESTAGNPLLVVGEYGAGRVAAFAGDTTWQWWMQGRSEAHRRFWRQTLLWLLARDAPTADAVWIKMESRRFERESPSAFTAGVQALASDTPPGEFTAEVIDEAGQRKPVALEQVSDVGEQSGQPLVRGQLPELPGGLYRLRVAPADSAVQQEQGPIEPAEVVFQVVDIDAELSRPLAEISRLEQLAQITADAGGRAFRPDEVEALLDAARQLRRQGELPIVEKNRLGDDPLSGWLLMLVMLGLLSAEWYCRRAWGLA